MRAPNILCPRGLRLAALAATVAAAACAAHTQLGPSARRALAARHVGKVVELRQSSYYGELYDENTQWLLSPRPPAEVSHIDDPQGRPLHPPPALGMLPAGTAMTIESIAFPDVWTMAGRLLTTPRYNPWVVLRGVPDAPGMPAPAKPFVIVLPLDLQDEGAVEAALAAVLAPAGAVSAWLSHLPPSSRAAVLAKEVVVGMDRASLFAALGEPPHWFADRRGQDQASVAWYPDVEAWLVGDQVVDVVRPPRALPAPPARAAAPAATPNRG